MESCYPAGTILSCPSDAYGLGNATNAGLTAIPLAPPEKAWPIGSRKNLLSDYCR